jgi:ATP-dependent helicase HrpA
VSNYIPLISIPGRTFGVTTNFDAPESSFGDDLEVAIREKQNVIIFAPGKKEIETLIQELQEKFGRSAEIFPLHAEMSISEQNMLLTKTTTLPRIVVATNIAEESITIPYMYMVADFGTQKVLRYTRRGIPTLGVENTALANCTQRA